MKNLTLKDFVLISEQEAIDNYSIDEQINGFCDMNVALFDGNLTIDGDFTLEGAVEEVSGYVITGNLTVGTYIFNTETDYGPFLFVKGKTKAQNINLGGSEAYFADDVEVENVIYGEYNHGSIVFDGNVKAKVVLAYDHWICFNGEADALIIEQRGAIEGVSADFYDDNIQDILIDELIDAEGYLNSRDLCNYINDNKNIIKSNIKTPAQLFEERIDDLVTQKCENIDLTGEKSVEFPNKILNIKNMKSLTLDSCSIFSIPVEIKNLKELKELSIKYCSLNELPEELFELTNLEILNISGNNIKFISDKISNFKKLKELHFSGSSYSFLEDFPIGITKLENLKVLNLSGHFFKEIPNELINLTNLEELNFNSALACVKNIVDFSKLPKLKKLYIDGRSSRTDINPPSIDVLLNILNNPMPQLETLSIDRWGNAERYNEEKNKNEIIRFGLTQLPENFGENFPNLKEVDLSFLNLTTLPDSFYKLKNLIFINLEYTSKLNKKTIEKLMKVFPKTKMNLRNIDFKNKKEDEDQKYYTDKVKQAAQKMQYHHNEAVELFKNIINEADKSGKCSDYNYLYAHYGILYCYTHGLVHLEKNENKQIERQKEFEVYALKTIELLPQNGLIWHFTDEGAFQEEIFREIYGGLSWYKYQQYLRTKDEKLIEEAFKYVEEGTKFIQSQTHYYLFDTKVRILIALDKIDEAYLIVKKVLKDYPSFGDFQDIKNSEVYKKWLSIH